jgi:hypothetical protein
MPPPDDSYLRHQRQRWLRHDAHLWIRPDAARWVKPGTDPADIYPTLARKVDAAQAAAFEAEVAAGYRLLAVLREEVASFRAELKRRRLEEAKYSPSQPRVPAGNPRGGQWTDRSGGQGAVAGPSQDTGQSQDADLTQPMGNVDVGDLTGSSELGDLFQIRPSDTRTDGVRLAANDTPDDPTPVRDPTPIREAAPLVDPAPKIPLTRPETSTERTDYMRSAANWLMRNGGLAATAYTGNMNNVEWLKDRQDLIAAYRDEPKTLEELQRAVQEPKPGYDVHHIVEQTPAERFGFRRSEVDDPENLVRIPRLRHYEITGWYGTANDKFDRLSPREYLQDKDWAERYRVGLEALKQFKVLK